jgi:hypothetical protein
MTTTTRRVLGLVALLATACGGQKEPSATLLVQLQVTPPAASVPAGLTQQLTATAVYENGHREDVSGQVAWASTDEAVASVDGHGLVLTVAAGRVQLTATLPGKSASATLVVTDAVLVSLELVPDRRQVPLGVAVTAALRGRFTDGAVVDLTSRAAWSTPIGGLVVETPGVARGAARGPARLCARFQGMMASVDLEVTDAEAVDLRLAVARDLGSLPKGARAVVVATADFTDGTRLDVTADVAWSSSAPAVATVEGGRVCGLELGSARLEATYQGRSAALAVTVHPAEVVALSVTPTLAVAPAGDDVPLTALAHYSDGSTGDVTDLVTWSALDPRVVQLSNEEREAGHAYGLVHGAQTVVTAQLPGTGLSATTLVLVGPPSIESFRIDQAASVESRTASAGDDLRLSATARYSDDETEDATRLLRWESFSPGVALADPQIPGLIHALAPGRATIVVTLPGDPLIWMSVEVFVR